MLKDKLMFQVKENFAILENYLMN